VDNASCSENIHFQNIRKYVFYISGIQLPTAMRDFRFRYGVNEIFAYMACYAAWMGRWLPTFRDNLSVPSARVKQPSIDWYTVKTFQESMSV
jgi:hypothetical protein